MSSYRRLTLLVGAVTTSLLMAACSSTSAPSGPVSAGPASGDALELRIERGAFTASTLELPAGREIVIQVTNRDNKNHDFAVPSLNLNTGTLVPGGVATARVRTADQSLVFVCTFHGDMVGRLVPRS
jgi:hypothetical protein